MQSDRDQGKQRDACTAHIHGSAVSNAIHMANSLPPPSPLVLKSHGINQKKFLITLN